MKEMMTVPQLDTPALLLDLDAFNHNVARMAAFFADKRANLRPHAKTHKCPQIALRQLEAGAIGITCAKVGEAEVMAAAGGSDILIANQVAGRAKIERLSDLAGRCDLMVAVDDPANIDDLAAACAAKRVRLRVLVEVDIGMRRGGGRPGRPALGLAREIAATASLHFAGLMGYEGHLVLLQGAVERAGQVRAAVALLESTRQLIEAAGLPVEIVSGGGTGTYDVTGSLPPMTEIQAGSYVFMDSTYRAVRTEFKPALSLLSTVVSRPVPERLVTDAGLKVLTTEFGWPQPLDLPQASVHYLSEEHGVLNLAPADAVNLRPGDTLRFLPSHCCTTTNLHDRLFVIQNDTVVDIWPIAARGRSQ